MTRRAIRSAGPVQSGKRERLRIYKGHFEDHVAFDRQRHDRDWKNKRMLTEATFGWAITGHKSQGSQWENVIVWDDGLGRNEADRRRWLYTVITRAEQGAGDPVMIDLNEVWQPPARYDLDEIRERLCATAAEWLPPMFPHARLSPDRKTLRCADLSGRPPRNEGSCVIHLRGPRAGWGYDHATGECAGPIDLIHHSTGLTPTSRCSRRRPRRRGWTGRLRLATGIAAKPDHSHEVARILAGCGPLADQSPSATCSSRGLRDPACPDLLFNDDLSDFETKRGWPGMVAVVRDGAGEPTGGIHRTYLLDDGSAKAPPGKKMLGPVAGGSVRLSRSATTGISASPRASRPRSPRKRSSACRPGRRSRPMACGDGSGRKASRA